MKGTDARPEILRPFDPRHVPLPAPLPDVCDAPTVTICVNSEWWSHLDGMISRLLYRDAWQGTEDEIDRAIEQVQEILAVGKADPMGCCCGNSGALTRYNENGELEISTDGGATWNPYPQGDPRMTGRIAPPIPGVDGDDKKCAAAASAEEFVKQNFIDELETGQGYAAIYDALIALLAIIALTGIGLLIAALVGAVFTAGITVVKAAFTSEVWTTFRCILYCRISDDGSFTKTAWEGVKADILDQFTGVVSAVLYNWVNSVGPVGLTNSARSGFVASADCTSCDCPCQTISISATSPDTDTGISIDIGDDLIILATGTWSYNTASAEFTTDADGDPWADPNEFQMPAENIGALIGRIGDDGDWFLVGATFSMTASEAGILHLGFNDDNFPDNGGALDVEICVNATP